MCGIIGYIGAKEALPIVIGGLQRLEYRGYDSAGVAVLSRGQTIETRRSVGKLSNLTESLAQENGTAPRGTLGMGHTRWATHGKPSEENAHPHRGPRDHVVVVHNGIIENHLQLKKDLAAQGYAHPFKSETDTEVLAHLLEKYVLVDGLALEKAMLQVLGQIQGTAAIVAFCADNSQKIVAARLSNAGGVVIGYGSQESGENYVASDIPAILPHTRRVSFLESGEVAVLERGGVTFYNARGETVTKEITVINMDAITAAKGGYKHFMQKEIYDQPQALTDTICGRVSLENADVYLEDMKFTAEELAAIEKVTIVACGTSWHAGLIAKYMIEELARLPVEVDYASEYRYRNPIVTPSHLVIAITQSGETVDTLAAMEEAHNKGAKLVSIVNAVGSQAARISDGIIYMHAGPEIGVASTKAFTASLADLLMLGVYLGRRRGTLEVKRAHEILTALTHMPKQVSDLLAQDTAYDNIAKHIGKATDFLYLGRGIQYPVALEGALKLKELSYIHAEGYPSGEMKHGPIALIDANFPVVAIATQDHLYSKMLSAIQQVQARDAWVMAIATEGDTTLSGMVNETIFVPQTDPLLTPILTTIPLQLLSYHIANRRGCDVDQPRNLAKSVTVE
jgi:glutamine---fructose-6-phosphate transaminase (isomerizing)